MSEKIRWLALKSRSKWRHELWARFARARRNETSKVNFFSIKSIHRPIEINHQIGHSPHNVILILNNKKENAKMGSMLIKAIWQTNFVFKQFLLFCFDEMVVWTCTVLKTVEWHSKWGHSGALKIKSGFARATQNVWIKRGNFDGKYSGIHNKQESKIINVNLHVPEWQQCKHLIPKKRKCCFRSHRDTPT